MSRYYAGKYLKQKPIKIIYIKFQRGLITGHRKILTAINRVLIHIKIRKNIHRTTQTYVYCVCVCNIK